MAQEEQKKEQEEIWSNYISHAYSQNKPTYYVKDIDNCKEKDEVKIILLCESPHEEEVAKANPEYNLPLVGSSGQSVANFLFGKNKTDSIGKLVKKGDRELPKMAIVNVCNVPLQVIDANKNDVSNLSLDRMRNNCWIIPQLADNLKTRLEQYQNATTIIVCGEFAETYYNNIVLKAAESPLKKLRPLYVPHPSRNQWSFIEKHQKDLFELKDLFKTRNKQQ